MKTLQLKFVEYIPEKLEDDVLYISITYRTVVHLCVCGCKNEVVTPISPTDWKLIFNGESISLNPSIGNWNFKCQSHYWIKENKIIMLPHWTQEKIEKGLKRDEKRKKAFFRKRKKRN